MPENEIHQTQPAPPPKPSESLGELYKKYLPAATGIIVFGICGYFYGSHDSAKKIEFQTEINRQNIEKMLQAEKERTEAQNQLVIAVAKLSEQQARLASDVKDIQGQQQRNTEMILNRK